jgi:hypothetical protein
VFGGLLLLEAHTHAAVYRMGTAARSWHSAERGLFSERPHLRLDESAWDEARDVATRRYLIVDAETADVAWYAESVQAYTEAGYRAMLNESGFMLRATHASWDDGGAPGEFSVLVAAAN